jgi:hypothetical protein
MVSSDTACGMEGDGRECVGVGWSGLEWDGVGQVWVERGEMRRDGMESGRTWIRSDRVWWDGTGMGGTGRDGSGLNGSEWLGT